LISDAQNGFREKKSTFTAIQSFIEDAQNVLDNKLFALGIFLDLSKAFDVINHKLLHNKLELYGLRGNSHSLMSSYLTGRSQFVEIQHIDAKTSSLLSFTSSCKELKYCHVLRMGSVTNNSTWIRIGYRIYSLWLLQLHMVTITMNTKAPLAPWIP
jgi:hypothetical protein